MRHKLEIVKTVAVIALALPLVTGCKTCEGGACATSAGEKGKASCKTQKCGGGACAGKAADMKASDQAVISTSALKTLLDAKTPLVLLDARTGKYDDGRRIPGAGSLSSTAKPAEVAKAIPAKDTLVVTYCSNLKCPASNALAEHLTGLGYKNVLEYSAGIAGWAEAGNEIKEDAK